MGYWTEFWDGIKNMAPFLAPTSVAVFFMARYVKQTDDTFKEVKTQMSNHDKRNTEFFNKTQDKIHEMREKVVDHVLEIKEEILKVDKKVSDVAGTVKEHERILGNRVS